MTNPFATALLTLHRDPALSVPARYRQQNAGPPFPIRVIRMVDEKGRDVYQRVRAHTEMVQVRRVDAPMLAVGDTLEIHDAADPLNPRTCEMLVVSEAPELDSNGLAWTACTRRA